MRVPITSSLVQCHAPVLVAVTKFKTTKVNFEGLFGLSMKITRHTVLKKNLRDRMSLCSYCTKILLVISNLHKKVSKFSANNKEGSE